jgi:hypothetical protein
MRWDEECDFNPFNKDGSPIPFTKVQQAKAYRIHTLACGLETSEKTIDLVADLIERNPDCHFDPRYDWLHLPLRIKIYLKEMQLEWMPVCRRCGLKSNRCQCDAPDFPESESERPPELR